MSLTTILLAVALGFLLLVGLAARELQHRRERVAVLAACERMRLALETTRQQLQRATEEVYVLESILVEHNVLDEPELAQARVRLVELPRRRAQERQEILRNTKASPPQIVVDDDPHVH